MKVLWKLCHGFSFPAEVITFHSYGDSCSVGYLGKYMHYTSQLDFCLRGTNTILYSMAYRRVTIGYLQCCREEQNLILNSSPKMLYNMIKQLVRFRQLVQVEKKNDNLPKTVCRIFSLLIKFEYLYYFKIQPTPSGSGSGLNIEIKKISHFSF